MKFFQKHPLITATIAILFIGVLHSTFNSMSNQDKDLTALRCDFVDSGLDGFFFAYSESSSRIKFDNDKLKIINAKFLNEEISFRALDDDQGAFRDFVFNKNTRFMRLTKSNNGLEKVKVGRIFCKNDAELRIEKERAARELDDAWFAYARLKKSIEINLRDADSAKWGRAYVTKDKVCANVNAKNGFGGYTGSRSYCARKDSNGDWSLDR